MLIEDIRSVIKSMQSNEFILHFPSFFDLRIQCDRRDSFLDILKLTFAHKKPDLTLKIYGVPGASLKEFHTTPSNKKYGIDNLPP